MAVQTLYPKSGLSSTDPAIYAAIDNALLFDGLVIGYPNQNASWEAVFSVDNLVGSSPVLYFSIRVQCRKGSNSGNPFLKATLSLAGGGGDWSKTQNILSTTTQARVYTWDAAVEPDACLALQNHPTNIWVRLEAQGVGGSPSNRNSVEIDYFEVVVSQQDLASLAITSSGSGTSSGSVAISLSSPTEWSVSATGSAVTVGALSIAMLRPLTGQGVGVSAGAANVDLRVVHQVSATGSGASAGSANIERRIVHQVSANGSGVSAGGAAIETRTPLVVSAAGSSSATGSGAFQLRNALRASGTATTSGSGSLNRVSAIGAAGSTVTVGSCHLVANLTCSTTGSATTAGGAAPSASRAVTASGLGSSSGSVAISLTDSRSITASAAASTFGTASITIITEWYVAAFSETSTKGRASFVTAWPVWADGLSLSRGQHGQAISFATATVASPTIPRFTVRTVDLSHLPGLHPGYDIDLVSIRRD